MVMGTPTSSYVEVNLMADGVMRGVAAPDNPNYSHRSKASLSSYRVCDFVAWARAVKGKPIRIFAYFGSEGEVLANVGDQTAEEAKLKFANLSGLSRALAT
jgi:hypothetical protein